MSLNHPYFVQAELDYRAERANKLYPRRGKPVKARRRRSK